jgi:hypothetical protein
MRIPPGVVCRRILVCPRGLQEMLEISGRAGFLSDALQTFPKSRFAPDAREPFC